MKCQAILKPVSLPALPLWFSQHSLLAGWFGRHCPISGWESCGTRWCHELKPWSLESTLCAKTFKCHFLAKFYVPSSLWQVWVREGEFDKDIKLISCSSRSRTQFYCRRGCYFRKHLFCTDKDSSTGCLHWCNFDCCLGWWKYLVWIYLVSFVLSALLKCLCLLLLFPQSLYSLLLYHPPCWFWGLITNSLTIGCRGNGALPRRWVGTDC